MPVPSPARILIIDDESELLAVMAEYLTSLGYVVAPYPGAKEALDEFRAGWFDLLITDLSMPGMRGGDLIAEILERDPALAVVVMTASPNLLEEHQRAGVLDILEKPLRFDRFRASVRRGIAHTRQTRA